MCAIANIHVSVKGSCILDGISGALRARGLHSCLPSAFALG